jgi:hypothetical protein
LLEFLYLHLQFIKKQRRSFGRKHEYLDSRRIHKILRIPREVRNQTPRVHGPSKSSPSSLCWNHPLRSSKILRSHYQEIHEHRNRRNWRSRNHGNKTRQGPRTHSLRLLSQQIKRRAGQRKRS